MNEFISINEIESAINTHSDLWIGHCHLTSSKILKSGIITGNLVYGHYHGPIHEDSIFSMDVNPSHGWIELGDDTICDPTRWVFDNVEPYLYMSKKSNADYQKVDLKEITTLSPKKSSDECSLNLIPLDTSNGSFAIRYLLHTDKNFISYIDALWIFHLPSSILTKAIHDFFQSINFLDIIESNKN